MLLPTIDIVRILSFFCSRELLLPTSDSSAGDLFDFGRGGDSGGGLLSFLALGGGILSFLGVHVYATSGKE